MNANTVNADAVRRFDPAGELRRAIDGNEFVLYYQPQLDYAGKLRGAEALIRWRHTGRGMVFPADFIDLAEESGLIVEIGAWALFTACKQLASWQRKHCTRSLTLAVNVSARQVSEPDFVALAVAMIEATGADPHMLKLEITESLRVTDLGGAAAKMHLLRAMGVSFSLDDFGTGHSSLRYLKDLPLDQLKIDQSFVRDIATNGTDVAIVRSTVSLARSLGLSVIAEGVETPEQRELLAACGCFDYQGYLYDHALPAEAFYQFARCRAQVGVRLRPWQWKRHYMPARPACGIRCRGCSQCRKPGRTSAVLPGMHPLT